jgi:hypothetical protein
LDAVYEMGSLINVLWSVPSMLDVILSLKIAPVAEIVSLVPEVILTHCSISAMTLNGAVLLVPPKRKGTQYRSMAATAKGPRGSQGMENVHGIVGELTVAAWLANAISTTASARTTKPLVPRKTSTRSTSELFSL